MRAAYGQAARTRLLLSPPRTQKGRGGEREREKQGSEVLPTDRKHERASPPAIEVTNASATASGAARAGWVELGGIA